MATRPNIVLPASEWVDLNAALNAQAGFPAVTLGAALNIKLESSTQVRVCEKAIEPTSADGYRRLVSIDTPYAVTNDVGTWAISLGADGVVNVEV